MGNVNKQYDYRLTLNSAADLQIRDIALESTRLLINRHAEKKIGKGEFYCTLRVYPHHHLRENALASGAGADRLSTGMKFSFGKVVGIAAQIRQGQPIIELRVSAKHLNTGKAILHTASSKLPCSTTTVVEKLQ